MKFWRLIVIATGLLIAVLAVVLYLDWRASRATGRSLLGSVTLVPSEAQRLYTQAKRSSPVEAAKGGVEDVLEKVDKLQS